MNNIVKIDPLCDPRWQKLVNQQKSDVFHSLGWLTVLKSTYDFKFKALVKIDRTGDPIAGMVYCKIEDMMDSRISSLPFSDFCDPLIKNRDDWDSIIDILVGQECKINLRVLHNDTVLNDERFPMVNRALWHCVDLRREVEDLWHGLSGSARRAINKAKRSGIEIRIAKDKSDLRAFFELHLGVRKYKYKLVAQPYSFFEHIWDQFIEKDRGVLMLAVHENRVIAGVLFLEWQDKLYYKFNASNPDYTNFRPNDLIVWNAINYGHTKGYEYLDFGISDWDQEGLLRYKRKYATQEKTVSFLRYTPEKNQSLGEKQMRLLLPQITNLFVDEAVPDHITEKAGEVLYRFFL